MTYFEKLVPGDVLVFRPSSLAGRIVALLSWSEYSHAGMVSIDNGVVYCIDVILVGQKKKLADYLNEYPSVVEVWRPRDFLIEAGIAKNASKIMEKFVGVKYGWWHAIWAVFGKRFSCRHRECERHTPFCSEAVSRAYREAGFDLRIDIADRFTFPKDLTLSPYLQHIADIRSA